MEDKFLEIKPGYLIALSSIQAVRWKDGNLRIAYDKGGSSTTVEIEDVRGSAEYMYDNLRKIAITYEMGPEFDTDEEL